MKRKPINPYFVRSVIAVLLILLMVVCTILMGTNRESSMSDIPGTTAETTIEVTTETTVEATTPTTEQTEPVTAAIDIPTTTAATEPKPTEPKPTEPKPTEPKPTEPKPTEPPATEPTPTVMSDLDMLACVIYQEVGSDSICNNCRYYVGDIVLNRVADDRFPNDIHGVLTQKNQYGKFSSTGVKWPSRASNPNEAHAVERAYRVAQDILNGNHSKLYGNGYIWQAGFKQGSEGFWCCGHFYGK